jgi:hypothetical protein
MAVPLWTPLQQLGGAVGTAVLVTVLSLVSGAQASGPSISPDGMAGMFTAALLLILLSAAGAPFLSRRAGATPADLPTGH